MGEVGRSLLRRRLYMPVDYFRAARHSAKGGYKVPERRISGLSQVISRMGGKLPGLILLRATRFQARVLKRLL